MKRWCSIVFLVGIVAFSACNRLVETRHDTSLPTDMSPELSAIDSLMWQRPDSALTCLLPYFDTCCRDGVHTVSTTHDCHYANLLLAELLYKNDNPQLNRAELLQAVDYYDSLHACTDVARNVSTNAFLDARAHYINGVGYYERDSVVEACQEYLKALEVMEDRFDEKELKGKKAILMAFTYNRLTELFSTQYMMDPAIACGEKALMFCRIAPTSKFGISNNLYYLGKQYDKMNQTDKANQYYGQALEEIPSMDNLVYRDIVSSKALCDYQAGKGLEQSLTSLRKVLVQAEDYNESLTRYLSIGTIFYKEKMYDSALIYLAPIFYNKGNEGLRIAAAEQLHFIYKQKGDDVTSDECMRYIALQNKSGAEEKALVSKLEDVFKSHTDRELEKDSEKARNRSIRDTLIAVLSFTILVVLFIIVFAAIKRKKLLKKVEEDSDRRFGETERHYVKTIEAERQAHQMAQAAISGKLKRRNKEVRELKDKIKLLNKLNATPKQAESFTDEPICRLILERVKNGQFLSNIDCKIYKDYALSKEQLISLREVADLHFGHFSLRLAKAYPKLTKSDIDYCCLYLLDLTDADISALMQRAYNTINERHKKLKLILGTEKNISITLQTIAKENITV